jgi:biotin carboxyl carrier protein
MGAEIHATPRTADAAARLEQLCSFAGSEHGFWSSCLALYAEVAGARVAVLYRLDHADSRWHAVLALPAEILAGAEAKPLLPLGAEIAAEAVREGAVRRFLKGGALPSEGGWLLAVRAGTESSAVLWLGPASEAQAEDSLGRLRLVAHLPSVFALRQDVARSEVAVGHFAAVLDLAAQLNAQRRFVATAMTLCNELASRHQCDRVCLGWLKGEYVRLRQISHSEKFEKRMEAVQQLEAAMEESLDQDEPIVWPPADDQRLVTRDHAKFAAAQNVKHLCTLPLRLDGEPVAVLVCERQATPFTDVEARLLSLCGEVSLRRLADLERDDRWFGARWLAAGKTQAARLLGPRHTGAKLSALLLLGLLIWLTFGRIHSRVDAPFALRTEHAALIAAPFNSFLEDVKVEPGTIVKKGDVLATLDTRDLLLEEGGILADRDASLREAQKAKSAEKLADMTIAEARAAQALARAEIIRLRRSQAAIVAPFDGVVVEGDLKKRIGAPVRQGDVLFRVARTDQFYVECQVAEEDIRDLHPGGAGEIAFASNPKLKFPIHIRQLDPAADTHETGNVIIARCIIESAPADWWRPGMSGVAQLDTGTRSPGSALVRRTVDFLRLKFWW